MAYAFVRKLRRQTAFAAYFEQDQWIRKCGGDSLGYVLNYADTTTPEHALAIYRADREYLRALAERGGIVIA